MDTGNLDFEIEMDADLWRMLGRTAAALGPERGGYAWEPEQGGEIRVYMRAEDAPAEWADRVSRAGVYGSTEQAVARFVFNDGRPYARIEPVHEPVEPAIPVHEQAVMRRSLEQWVRHKWHDLMRRSGHHYDRGHLPQA